MKRFLFIVGMLLVPVVVVGADPAPKVVICHATGSESNPWVRTEVSENAIGGHFDNPGTPLEGHEDDLLLEEGAECPVDEVPEEEEPEEEPEEPTEEPEEPSEEPETPTTSPVEEEPEVLYTEGK